MITLNQSTEAHGSLCALNSCIMLEEVRVVCPAAGAPGGRSSGVGNRVCAASPIPPTHLSNFGGNIPLQHSRRASHRISRCLRMGWRQAARAKGLPRHVRSADGGRFVARHLHVMVEELHTEAGRSNAVPRSRSAQVARHMRRFAITSLYP